MIGENWRMESFILWWQHLPSQMSENIITIGGFSVKYYGLMYLVAFVITYLLALYRTRKEPEFPYDSEFLQNFLIYQVFGVMLGGRLGYVLFYNLPHYLMNPWEILLPIGIGPDGSWQFQGFAGMSYHGGLLGVIVAGYLFSIRNKVSFWNLADLFAPAFPLGYTFGRIGNFINGELWGRPTDAAIGMYFPRAPGDFLRHPSQLYEAFFEGIFLFLILWSIRRWRKPEGTMLPLYVFGYGFVRYFIEYFREPDAHLGTILLGQSMGQLLCIAMMLGGVVVFLYLINRSGGQMSYGPLAKSTASEEQESQG